MNEILDDDFGFFIDILSTQQTGLPFDICVSNHNAYLDNLGPRIRLILDNNKSIFESTAVFFNNVECMDINIRDDYRSFIAMFIILNKDHLIEYWDNVYDSLSLDLNIKSIL